MNKPIKKAPIRDQIYDIIKASILGGKYEPGDRLSIAAISKELHVSNSPVREAISMLNRDGLVDIYPNSGPSVIKFSNKRLANIAQAILSMLLGAFEICQQSDKMDDLVGLLQNALKMQIAHTNADTMQEYVRYSIGFESAFIKCCDNPYMTKQYTEIEDLFYLVVLYNQIHIEKGPQHTVLEHQQILGAITSGDYLAAKDLLSKHYNRFQLKEDLL